MSPAGRDPARRRLRAAAADVLAAALRAVDPAVLVRRHVRRRGPRVLLGGQDAGTSPITVVAVGKAASVMAATAWDVLGDRAAAVLAVDASDHVRVPPAVRRLVAGHPTPDARGLRAAAEVERAVGALDRGDVLLFLLSGGASSLLPAPAPGIRLSDKVLVTRRLLAAGATIGEINAVRRHLSRLKGGGLARLAAPARVVTLALSDVVGDDPAAIGSGPTAADPTTFADARAVLARYRLLTRVPAAVRRHLERGAAGEVPETLKPGAPRLGRMSYVVVGGPSATARAAAREARRLGFRVADAGHAVIGEARQVGARLASVLRPRSALVGSGETTVTVRGAGRGGRNQEMAVAAATVLPRLGVPAVAAFLGTDGVDGPTTAAGGVVDDRSAARAERLGLAAPADVLADNDAHRWLAALGDLIVTGPTGTNAADVFVLIAG